MWEQPRLLSIWDKDFIHSLRTNAAAAALRPPHPTSSSLLAFVAPPSPPPSSPSDVHTVQGCDVAQPALESGCWPAPPSDCAEERKTGFWWAQPGLILPSNRPASLWKTEKSATAKPRAVMIDRRWDENTSLSAGKTQTDAENCSRDADSIRLLVSCLPLTNRHVSGRSCGSIPRWENSVSNLWITDSLQAVLQQSLTSVLPTGRRAKMEAKGEQTAALCWGKVKMHSSVLLYSESGVH